MQDDDGARCVDDVDEATEVQTGGRRIFVRWTPAVEDLFFDHVSATGNVTAAAEAIGVSRNTVYYRLRTNPDFAAGWDRAVEASYHAVEAKMIESLLTADAFDWEKAMRMLTQRLAYRKRGHSGGPAKTVATPEQTDAAILKRLALIAARKRREPDGAETGGAA